jgi:hypothetical protein
MEAWKPRVKSVWKPCISTNVSAAGSNSNGYFIIEANGGLNQQRLSVCLLSLWPLIEF